jgi:PAS domain S-box-containing protein
MKITRPIKSILSSLRERAESLINLNNEKNENVKPDANQDLPYLVYELEVHQVELELQNEELRLAQLQLAHEHDRYLELYEHAPVSYLALDKAGKIHGANLKAEEVFSVHRSSIIGQRLSKFISRKSQDDLYLHQKNVFSSFTKQSVELRLKRNDGAQMVRIESIAVVSHSEKRTHSHTVIFDVTEERNAKKALKDLNKELENKVSTRTRQLTKQNALLTSILNTASDAIITVDLHGFIETVNPVTEEMFGYTESELIGSNISNLVCTSGADKYDGFLECYEGSGTPDILANDRELYARHKNGSRFPVSLSVNRLEKLAFFTCIIRDVGERIELEKEVLCCIEEERNRISRDLHDSLGQSLVGISMQAKSMASRLKSGQVDEWKEVHQFSEDIDCVAKNLRSIVSDLSLFEIGEDINVRDVIIMIVDNYRRYTSVNIMLELPESLSIKKTLVANQLVRIIQEAINNALKHAKAKNISIKIKQNSNVTKIDISDDGIGMQKKDGQSKNLTKLSGCGHGLNNMLYRAHIIGAKLDVVSNVGAGTSIQCAIFN